MSSGAHEKSLVPPTTTARQPIPRSRVRWVAFGALMLVALFVYVWDFNSFQFGYNPDSADYTLLAHALISSPEFALHYNAAAPTPTHFPFGYPLLVLPFVLFAPGDFSLPAWLSLAATLLNGALLFLIWHAIVPGSSDRWRFAVTAMFLLAPTTVAQARQVLSEAVFTTFLLAVIFLATRLLADPRSLRLWVALSISAFFLIFTRSIGLVCIGCIAIFFLVSFLRHAPHRRALLRGAGSAVLIFLLLGGAVLAFTPVRVINLVPTTYLDWYGFLGPVETAPSTTSAPMATPSPTQSTAPAPTQQAPTGRRTSVEVPRALNLNQNAINEHIHRDLRRMLTLTGGGSLETALAARLNLDWLPLVPGALALGMIALGNARWWRDTRRRGGLTVFQGVGLVYLAITILWSGGGDRLFYPIQPQLYFALLLGLYTIWQVLLRAGSRVLPALDRLRRQKFAALGLAVIVCGWLALALVRDFTLITSYEAWGNLDHRTEWIVANLPPDAVLLTDWPVRDYLETGLSTMEPPRGMRNPTAITAFLREHHITHILMALDDTMEMKGIAPYGDRVYLARDGWRELLSQGVLEKIHSDPLPVIILRVVP